MFNPKLTHNFNNVSNISKKYKEIIDNEGNILGGINKKSICDLNGVEIASFVSHIKQKNQNGKEIKVAKYESSFGNFKVYGDYVYLNNQLIGRYKKENKSGFAMLIASASLLLITTAILLLIETPDRTNQFVIDFKDEANLYEETGKIGVFPPNVHPGIDGRFVFSIKNNENVKVQYGFEIDEYYNQELIEDFPIKYRLRMNNLYVIPEELIEYYEPGEWIDGIDLQFLNVVMLARSEHEFTLEWNWEFENGNDPTDTLLGNDNGNYSLILNLTAQYYYENEGIN